MNRRDVIKKVGFGISAGLVVPAWLSACNKEDAPAPLFSYDGIVGIIGAGAAGLAAADILQAQGIPVIIFEASDRVGGRVHSFRASDVSSDSLLFERSHLPNNNFPIELGAEFIIGSDSAWGDIVAKQKVPVLNIHDVLPADGYIIDGSFKTASELAMDADFMAAMDFLESLKTYAGANVSMQDAIDAAGINARVQAILNSWIGNRFGTTNDRLSAVAVGEAFALITHNDTLQMPASNPMMNLLLSRFTNVIAKVQLNTAIERIDYSAEKIVLKDKNAGLITVNKVIITTPIPILKTGIAFVPSLPAAKTAALSTIGMDASIRVLLEFKKNVWSETSAFIFGGGTAPSYFSPAIGRNDINKFLSITINGSAAEALSPLGWGMLDTILEELDTVFDGKGSLNVARDQDGNIKAIIKDWTKEPYVKGGASYPMVGSTNADRETLAEPIDGKVFFAGEATDVVGDFGTVSGAIQSAQRAAQQLLDSLSS